MILAVIVLLWPPLSLPAEAERASPLAETRSIGAALGWPALCVARVRWLSEDSRHPDDLPADSSNAIIEEEEDESDDSNVFGVDVRYAANSPLAHQSRSLRFHEASRPAGPSARLHQLRC
jgi:hypothetical protein